MLKRWILLSLLVFGYASGAAALSQSGITYQGRILKPDGSPLSGANVQFRLQIRTPNSSDCLMYEEVKSLDMRNSNGIFGVTINDGNGSRTDSTALGLDRVFANYGNFVFDPTTCASGSSYTPSVEDGRRLTVLFKDETMSTWEPIPAQTINYVPYAIQASQLAGFAPTSILRVQDAGGAMGNFSPLSNAQYTELLALVNGTSTAFTKSGQLGGVALPTMSTGEVLGWNGTTWVSQTAVGGPNSVTTAMIQTGAVGTSQIASNVSISTSGTLASAITTTRDFKIFAASPSTFYVGMAAPALAASYTLTWPMTAGSANQVLTTDGSGALTWTTPAGTGISALTGDVTATGTGSVAATVASVGGSTATLVHSAELAANAATSSATASTIVKRDGSGGFTAGAVTQTSSVYKDSALNTVTVQAPTTVSSSYILKWPAAAGSAAQVLTTDAAGNLSWTSPLTSSSGFVQGGNTFGATADLGTNDNFDLRLRANGATAMTILPDGKVGVGTTAPLANLHIAVPDQGWPAANGGFYLQDLGGSAGYIQMTDGTGSANQFEPTLEGKPGGATRSFIVRSKVTPAQDIGTTPAMVVDATAAGSAITARPLLSIQNNSVPQVTVDAAGKVGVGTTSPAQKLEVVGNVAATKALLANGTVGAPAQTFSNDSTTGVYLVSPGVLGLAAGGTVPLFMSSTNVVANTLLSSQGGIGNSSGTAAFPSYAFGSDMTTGLYRPGASTIGISTGGAERVRITSAGDVGIGTTVPSTKLDVIGSLRVGDGGETCDTGHTGAIRYNGGNLQFCAGAMPWTTLGAAGAGLTALTGDVTASGTGSVAATVASVGGSTAALVHSAELAANAATALNTSGAIVKRDGTGNFAANVGTFNGVSLNNAGSVVNLVNPVGAGYTLTLPVDDGTTGQVLSTNGSGVTSWITPSSGGTPAGANTQIQFNDSGAFGASANLLWDGSNLQVGSGATQSVLSAGSITAAGTSTGAYTPTGAGQFPSTTSAYSQLQNNNFGDGSPALSLFQVGNTAGRMQAAYIGAVSNSGSGVYTPSLVMGRSANGTYSESLRIDASGNVGIGTTAPTGVLDVRGGTAANATNGTNVSVYAQAAGAGNQNGGSIYLVPGAATGTGTHGSTVIGTTPAPTWLGANSLYVNGYSQLNNTWLYGNLSFNGGGSSVVWGGGDAIGHPAANSIAITTASTERVRFDASGNVGIGTTSPVAKLDVHGSIVMSGSTSGYNGFKAAATAGSTVWTLPTADGTSGQLLSTNGSGILSWTSAGGGGDFLASGTVPMTGPIQASAGTAAAPSITFAGDPDTGFYNYTTNGVSLATAGVEKIRFGNNGSITGVSGVYFISQVSSQTNPTYSFNSDNNTGMFQVASDVLGFTTAGAEKLRINATGDVGIGTTSPNGKLDVKGAIVMSGATSGYTGFQPAAAAGSTVWTLPTADGSSGQILSTNGSGVLSWAAASAGSQWTTQAPGINYMGGRVGIGTTSASTLFDVAGAAQVETKVATTSATNEARTVYVANEAAGTNATNLMVGVSPSPLRTAYLNAYHDTEMSFMTQNTPRLVIAKGTDGGGLKIGSYASSAATPPSGGMIISGNVGIGTTAPAGIFDVRGGTAAAETSGTSINIFAQNAGSTATWKNGGHINLMPGLRTGFGTPGRVGIGTTSPIASLDVRGVPSSLTNFYVDVLRLQNNSGSSIRVGMGDDSNYNYNGVFFDQDAFGSDEDFYLGQLQGNLFALRNGATGSGLFMDGVSGNVGIGTSAPTSALEVSGAVVTTPNVGTGATVDLAKSNLHVLSSVGGTAITLNNMVNGGNYTIVVKDTTSRQYTFANCTTSKFLPANSATTAGTWSMYTILALDNGGGGLDCMITWATGYQ